MADWGFGMPPPGFMDLIAKKYSMEQQRTDAAVGEQKAQANLDQTRADLLPSESAATTGETQARTRGLDITNRFLPATLGATAFDTATRGLSNLSSSSYTDQQTKGLRLLQTPMSSFQLGL